MHLYAYIMPLQRITPPRVAEGWDLSPAFRGKLEDAELLYERLSSILLSVYGENSPELLSAAAWQELEVLPKKSGYIKQAHPHANRMNHLAIWCSNDHLIDLFFCQGWSPCIHSERSGRVPPRWLKNQLTPAENSPRKKHAKTSAKTGQAGRSRRSVSSCPEWPHPTLWFFSCSGRGVAVQVCGHTRRMRN